MKRLQDYIAEHKLKIWLVTAFAAIALLSILFVGLADEVREQETLPLDRAILLAINHRSETLLDKTLPVLTDVGGVVGVIVITAIMAALLLLKKQYRRLLIVVTGVGGAALLNLILKGLFERPRPTLWERLVVEHGYSFPSGHAMASAALGLAIIVALWNSRWRWWAVIGAALYIGFVGFSRLYLGVHYPSDIVAGWLVSGAWVAAVALIFGSRLGRRRVKDAANT